MVLKPGLIGEFGNDGRLRQAIFAATAVFAGALFAACAWSGTFAEGPIKVGLLLTYVGPTSIFARYEDKGARLLVEQTNKSGEPRGFRGNRKISRNWCRRSFVNIGRPHVKRCQ